MLQLSCSVAAAACRSLKFACTSPANVLKHDSRSEGLAVRMSPGGGPAVAPIRVPLDRSCHTSQVQHLCCL